MGRCGSLGPTVISPYCGLDKSRKVCTGSTVVLPYCGLDRSRKVYTGSTDILRSQLIFYLTVAWIGSEKCMYCLTVFNSPICSNLGISDGRSRLEVGLGRRVPRWSTCCWSSGCRGAFKHIVASVCDLLLAMCVFSSPRSKSYLMVILINATST